MSAFGKLSDKILGKLVPTREAAAVCPPDCITYTESGSGWCRRRTCCYRGSSCTWTCGSWYSC